MNELRWLQISDIHFNLTSGGCNDARDKLPDYIESIIKNIKLDFIIIAGDITYQNKGYQGVKEYLDKFQKLLKEECKNNFFIVPGNHDLKRTKVARTSIIDTYYNDEDKESIIDKRLYPTGNIDTETYTILSEAISEEFLSFYEDFKKEPYDKSKICTVKILDDLHINLIYINTCLFSYEKDNDPDKKDKLLLDTRGIKEELNKYKNNNLNVAIGHHSITCFSKECREQFINILEDGMIDLYLCGHTHNADNLSYPSEKGKASVICTGSITPDGSEIDVSLGRISLEDGQGIIHHYKWSKKEKIHNWITNLEASKNLDEHGGWSFFIEKLINNPINIVKKDIFENEFKVRKLNEEYNEKMEKFRQDLFEIHKVSLKIVSCGQNYKNRCKESEDIFYKLFRTTLFDGTQKEFFTKEDILVIYLLLHIYNIYKYCYEKKNSSVIAQLGKCVNDFTNNTKVTDICMKIIKACFDENKFNKMQHINPSRDNMEVHQKIISILVRFINKISYAKCRICNEFLNEKLYREELNEYMIAYNDSDKKIEINISLNVKNAFENIIEDKSIYRVIIDEIQNINDERMLFNSYCGSVCLIEAIDVNINFINNELGYDSTIYSINNTITSINYNLNNKYNEDNYNIFIDTYPEFKEENIKERISFVEEEG